MAYYKKKNQQRNWQNASGMYPARRGDIFWVLGDQYEDTSVIWPNRPAIIVSNDRNNEERAFVEVVYLTSSPKMDNPEHCTIRSAEKPSIALCEQICTIDKSQLGKHIGRCTANEMLAIEVCMAMSLGLEETSEIKKIDATDAIAITQEKEIERLKQQLRDANEKIISLRQICVDLINR